MQARKFTCWCVKNDIGRITLSSLECVAYLQWALPHLELHWPGFRKVRGQVCKRLKRRMHELDIAGFTAYRDYLAGNPQEWTVVDSCRCITISRFYRDKNLFRRLSDAVLPRIARRAVKEGRGVRCWSAGCASGEEVYSLKIVWEKSVRPAAPDLAFSIVGTDSDETVLRRAHTGCYERSTLWELPPNWVEQCFEVDDSHYCVKGAYRTGISFHCQDIRKTMPSDRFDIILCRNLVFTYFLPELQDKVLEQVTRHLTADGVLVIGAHEKLPARAVDYYPLLGCRQILHRRPGNAH